MSLAGMIGRPFPDETRQCRVLPAGRFGALGKEFVELSAASPVRELGINRDLSDDNEWPFLRLLHVHVDFATEQGNPFTRVRQNESDQPFALPHDIEVISAA